MSHEEASSKPQAAPISSRPTGSIPLTQLPAGTRCTIDRCGEGNPKECSLRAMGLRPDTTLRLCRVGRTCIVEVCDEHLGGPSQHRIGLTRDIASTVKVTPLAE